MKKLTWQTVGDQVTAWQALGWHVLSASATNSDWFVLVTCG